MSKTAKEKRLIKLRQAYKTLRKEFKLESPEVDGEMLFTTWHALRPLTHAQRIFAAGVIVRSIIILLDIDDE